MSQFGADPASLVILLVIVGMLLAAAGGLVIWWVWSWWCSSRQEERLGSKLVPVLVVDALVPVLKRVYIKSLLLDVEEEEGEGGEKMSALGQECRRLLVELQMCRVRLKICDEELEGLARRVETIVDEALDVSGSDSRPMQRWLEEVRQMRRAASRCCPDELPAEDRVGDVGGVATIQK